jgi:4-hydroxybenzoate polyprenyltransferase
MKVGFMRNRLVQYGRLMRLDKPIGILLLLWPTLWALWVAAEGRPSWQLIVIFTLGTVLMRSAGCVVNDLADMGFDGEVKRTRGRPLVTGAVGRREALILAALLALAAFLLIIFLNRLTIVLSVAALAIACTYPFFKRFFAIPQAYLGIAFGFGIPMAFAAQCDTVPPVGWLMLLANVFWAVAYDTEYAMVDRDDDVRIGIRTAAITFGRYDVLAVMVCYAATLSILAVIGRLSGLGPWYFAGLVGAAVMMGYHYALIRDRSREGSFQAFNHNNWVGGVIFLGMLVDYWQRLGHLWN